MVPARGRRWGCQERAGSPQEESREARLETGRAARGNPGRGALPWALGRRGMRRRGPVTDLALRPRGPGPPARRSPGHAAGRAPVHLPGGVQVHLHGGGGAAWPRAAGRRGPGGHRDGHGGGGGRGRGGGGRRRGGRGRRGGLGQLGGRRLLRRRLLRRLLLLRGLGDPRAPLAAAAPGASRTTARPSAFRHGPAGGGGRGDNGDRGDAERTPRLLPRWRRGLDSSPQPARPSARASEREAPRTRGASRRAVLALARRCLLRLAPPRHWVGVSGGAGSSGSRRPHPAPRGGVRARARAPGEPVGALF